MKINRTMPYSHLCSTEFSMKLNIFVTLPHNFFSVFNLVQNFGVQSSVKKSVERSGRGVLRYGS